MLARVILVVTLVTALLAPFTFMVPKKFVSHKKVAVDVSLVKENEVTKPVVNVPPVVEEKPLHNVTIPNFSAIYDVKSKKKQFFDFMQPAIAKQNKHLLAIRETLEYFQEQVTLELGLTEQEQQALTSLARRYRVSKHSSTLQQINELLVRVDIIPLSLVLVQAANESAWGTSRFARIGLNFFGIWCYQPKCGMVPNGRDEGAKHEVAAFQSLEEAVVGYFNNINTHNAYRVFRSIRAQLRAHNQPLDAEILATGLLPYSERGAHYVLDITDMLRHNERYFAYEDSESQYAEE